MGVDICLISTLVSHKIIVSFIALFVTIIMTMLVNNDRIKGQLCLIDISVKRINDLNITAKNILEFMRFSLQSVYDKIYYLS